VSDSPDLDRYPELAERWNRRNFIKSAVAGTALLGFGGALMRLAAFLLPLCTHGASGVAQSGG
jgi:hypothetical protein